MVATETILNSLPGSVAEAGDALQTDRWTQTDENTSLAGTETEMLQTSKIPQHMLYACKEFLKFARDLFNVCINNLTSRTVIENPCCSKFSPQKEKGPQLLLFPWHLTSGAWTENHSDQMSRNNCDTSMNNNCPIGTVNAPPVCLKPLYTKITVLHRCYASPFCIKRHGDRVVGMCLFAFEPAVEVVNQPKLCLCKNSEPWSQQDGTV